MCDLWSRLKPPVQIDPDQPSFLASQQFNETFETGIFGSLPIDFDNSISDALRQLLFFANVKKKLGPMRKTIFHLLIQVM